MAVKVMITDDPGALGIYQDDNGIAVDYVTGPYLAGNGLQSPIPVFVADGPIFADSMGNAQSSLAVTALPGVDE